MEARENSKLKLKAMFNEEQVIWILGILQLSYENMGHEYDEEVADHAQAIIKSINAQVLNIEEIEKQNNETTT